MFCMTYSKFCEYHTGYKKYHLVIFSPMLYTFVIVITTDVYCGFKVLLIEKKIQFYKEILNIWKCSESHQFKDW